MIANGECVAAAEMERAVGEPRLAGESGQRIHLAPGVLGSAPAVGQVRIEAPPAGYERQPHLREATKAFRPDAAEATHAGIDLVVQLEPRARFRRGAIGLTGLGEVGHGQP
jgi:hypothetical protein